ncbi:hypothetical protein V8D89_015695 [Ganoderma adspersum]
MSDFTNSLYFYDVHPYDCSHEAFNSESSREAVDDATATTTNHLTRTSSLTDIRNLPGPSTTSTHHPPSSPSYVPYFDLWDENAFPPVDIPLPEPLVASQPSPSTLLPMYSRAFDTLEESWVQDDLSLAVPEPSDSHGIWEVSPLGMDTYADGVHDGRILAEVRYLKPSDEPLEPDFLGESEYARARRQLELQRPAYSSLPEPLVFPPVRAPTPSAEHTTAASSLSRSSTPTEPPRRPQRRATGTPPVVEDIPTTTTSSGKGKGKEVVLEPIASSTSYTAPGKPKRKREDSEDLSAIAEADPVPPPASKKQRMSSEEVEGMMVLPKRLPSKCGCGAEFAERTVASIVDHFAAHYSEEERAGQEKLPCRWGKCVKELTYGQLVRHVKGDHVGVRWPCADCGRRFTRPNGVTRHKSSASACMKNQATAEDRE